MKRIDFIIEKPEDLCQIISRVMTEVNRFSPILDITFNYKRKLGVIRCKTISFCFQNISDKIVRLDTVGTGKEFNSLLNYMAAVWTMVTDTRCIVETV